MKNPLVIALTFNTGDAPQAESMLDWIYQLSGKVQSDHPIVLVAANNVHAELQMKVRLAAEMGFKHVELVVANNTDGEKFPAANRLFRAAAQTVANNYRAPWLLLEPDCVPLTKDWLEHLELAYDSQPKRYFGPRLKFQVKDEERMCIGKIAVYPNNAITDLSGYCDSIVPFYQLAGELVIMRSTKTALIQQGDIRGDEDTGKVRPDAVLLHSDKGGALIRHLRARLDSQVSLPPVAEPPVEKIDGRTKAARDRKATVTA